MTDRLGPYLLDTVVTGNAVTLYLDDCRVVMPRLEDQSIDVVITDPPYVVADAVELRGNGLALAKQKSTTIGDQGWTLSKDWLTEAARICRGHIVAFAGYKDMADLLEDHGQGEVRGIFTWRKPNAALPAWNVPHYDTEFAIWWGKGRNPSNIRSITSMVFDIPFPVAGFCASERIVDDSKKAMHPSQKPLSLMTRLVLAFTVEGEIVLDPFMGTGTTGVVCVQNRRRFVGIERWEPYYQIAEKRLRLAAQHPRLNGL